MDTNRTTRAEAGFTLIELLISMVVMTIVMGIALTVFSDASRLNQIATEMVNVNRDVVSAVDFIVRDLTQVGQGLPNTKVITIPSGTGIVVRRPGPPGSNLQFPPGTTSWPAVLPGPGLGPRLAPTGPLTDVITTLFTDMNFTTVTGEALDGAVAADGSNVVIGTPPVGIEVGDVLLFTLSGKSAVQTVTSVAGTLATSQTAQFAAGDQFGFNQRTAPAGSIRAIQPTAGVAFVAKVTRLRIVTYYIDVSRTPARLMRCVNSLCVGTTNAPQAVALGTENFTLSYDLVNGSTNPAGIRMTATDLAGGGGCGADPCAVGQIRKVNLYLALRSRNRLSQTDDFVHHSLSTQVSLRNLSFLDKYPIL
jgi:prepilin-type N-terminal cleavage/methylation domain-containing protein